MSTKPMPDTRAPALSLPLVGGGTWTLAERNPENFTMVVVYRGYHCPVCKSYLTKLNGLMDAAAEAGVETVVVSMDSAERAEAAKAEWDLDRLTIAYGLTVEDAKAWGLYVSTSIKEAEAQTFAEPGLFWIRPDGRLYLIDISNMPWSRPDVEFLLSKARFAVDNGYPARGTAAV
ncbi:redoxin domain-containing protein [Histidinibacterium lentulum]|nr:redoxin domain-containing protein [Histidinibacterium lentulum]